MNDYTKMQAIQQVDSIVRERSPNYNMRLPGEDEPRSVGFPMIYMVIGVSVFILIILFAVMQSNQKKNSGSAYLQTAMQQTETEIEESEPLEVANTKSKLRAEDLDFWDMYPVDKDADADMTKQGDSTFDTGQTGNASGKTTDKQDPESISVTDQTQEIQEDPATDGKHTLVKSEDGTEEWVLISPYLTKNTYDFTNLSESAGIKKYTSNGRSISYVGVDISKHTGAVKFNRLKATGVDYVMIRLGARGYATGQITLDDNFIENVEEAIEAGLDIGIYFYSQAISAEEANEEANFVIQTLEPYKEHITYPVACDMEKVPNDGARIDGLSREDKTTITNTFLSSIQAAGYIPMIYGNKEWLIKNIDLGKLQNYDVWLAQEQDIPDYPYQYAMWQYTTTGLINGIEGDADLNICFVSYLDR